MGWENNRLGELANVNYGFTAKANHEKGDLKFLRITDIQDDSVNWDTVPFCKIPEKNPDKYILKRNDIVFARTGATTGKSYLIVDPPQAVFASYLIKATVTSNKILPSFLYRFFQTAEYWNIIEAGTSGSAQGGFNASKLKDLIIPLPPLPEQRRLVHLLDTAFGEIERARGLLARNLVNAGELFESRLGEVFGRLEKEYKKQPLSELSYLKSGGTPSRRNPENWTNGNIEWYSSGELNDVFTRDSKEFITQYGLENSNARIFPEGSLLIGIYDTAALKMSISDRPVTFNQAIVGVEPSDKILMRFLMLGIEAQKSDLLLLRRGTRQKNLSLAKIKAIEVAVPPVKIQKQLIKEVDEWFESINDVRSHYTHQLHHLTELKQSLLARAFAGEL